MPETTICPADTARMVARSVSAAYGVALMLQGAAARTPTQTKMASAAALLKAAEEELEAAAWEFVGDRVEREAAK